MAAPKHGPAGDTKSASMMAEFSGAIQRAQRGERVTLLGEDDAPVAVVVSLADLKRMESDDRRRATAIETLMAVGDRFARLDPAEVDREAVEAVREVRASMYAERIGRDG